MATPLSQGACWWSACWAGLYWHITWVGPVKKQAALLYGSPVSSSCTRHPTAQMSTFSLYPRSAALWAGSCLAISICTAQAEHPQAQVTGLPVSANICLTEEGTVAMVKDHGMLITLPSQGAHLGQPSPT